MLTALTGRLEKATVLSSAVFKSTLTIKLPVILHEHMSENGQSISHMSDAIKINYQYRSWSQSLGHGNEYPPCTAAHVAKANHGR